MSRAILACVVIALFALLPVAVPARLLVPQSNV